MKIPPELYEEAKSVIEDFRLTESDKPTVIEYLHDFLDKEYEHHYLELIYNQLKKDKIIS